MNRGSNTNKLKILEARWEVLEECISHLEQGWTDDKTEREQVNVVIKTILKKKQAKIESKINYLRLSNNSKLLLWKQQI